MVEEMAFGSEPGASRAKALWSLCRAEAQACLDHPFVQGIASGELDRSLFAWYVGQDAFFLRAFARGYALALAKAPEEEGMRAFRHLLDGVLGELALHQEYARQWGLDLDPEPAPATRAYTDFLLRVAWSEPPGRIVAAMTPCMRLYAFLGQELRGRLNPQSAYRAWVETYASPDFEALARRLEELLDRYDDRSKEMEEYYRTAMQLEYRFFDAAWRSQT